MLRTPCATKVRISSRMASTSRSLAMMLSTISRRPVIDCFLGVRILLIEVDGDDTALFVTLDQSGGRYLPCLRSFLPVVPPGEAAGKFLIPQGLGLGVFFAALGQGCS